MNFGARALTRRPRSLCVARRLLQGWRRCNTRVSRWISMSRPHILPDLLLSLSRDYAKVRERASAEQAQPAAPVPLLREQQEVRRARVLLAPERPRGQRSLSTWQPAAERPAESKAKLATFSLRPQLAAPAALPASRHRSPTSPTLSGALQTLTLTSAPVLSSCVWPLPRGCATWWRNGPLKNRRPTGRLVCERHRWHTGRQRRLAKRWRKRTATGLRNCVWRRPRDCRSSRKRGGHSSRCSPLAWWRRQQQQQRIGRFSVAREFDKNLV